MYACGCHVDFCIGLVHRRGSSPKSGPSVKLYFGRDCLSQVFFVLQDQADDLQEWLIHHSVGRHRATHLRLRGLIDSDNNALIVRPGGAWQWHDQSDHAVCREGLRF